MKIMILKKFLVFIFFATAIQTFSQQPVINILDSGRKTSLRGLSVVDDNIIWASGSNGTVARSTNGGKSFEWLTVQGYEERDFRDIEAFDINTALIMAVAEPAIILKTKDGGKTWKKVFEDTTKGMFLDAMDFSVDKKYGVVVGDPIEGRFFLGETFDQGATWNQGPLLLVRPVAYEGQACFAASGTNILALKSDYAIVTGGKQTEFIKGVDGELLPMIQGKETTGANSLTKWKEKKFVVVGGDFANDKDTAGNCALSSDGGITWTRPQTPPHGYRSCVEYITENKLITCGTSGVDISKDGGMDWELISTQSFHVCQRSKKGSKVFLAGANGKIATLNNF
jgi:photosystem II stability/assembly factor-like uncharacterized protein